MVVALSEERALPTPEVRCSNPVIRNFYTTFIYFSLLNSWLYIKRGRGWTIFLIESFKIRRKKQLMTLLKWNIFFSWMKICFCEIDCLTLEPLFRLFEFANSNRNENKNVQMSFETFCMNERTGARRKKLFCLFQGHFPPSLPLSLSLTHKRTLFIEPYIHSLSL